MNLKSLFIKASMNTSEYVILVDEYDNPIGFEEKLKAHQDGKRHRAFSVFIFRQNKDDKWELLLQQRQFNKYHSGGLWTNTCCSHPRKDEDILEAGKRRLFEEVGIQTNLQHVGYFHYIAHLDQGLTENELDHVLIGFYSEDSAPFNLDEIAQLRWITLENLEKEFQENSNQFTKWFNEAYQIAKRSLFEGNK
jgi:isopentenyl-diphosphate delta-isomerase type 1